MEIEPVDILLVEDNPGDVVLIRRALSELTARNRLTVAENGVQALAMLRREDAHAETPRPALILLDLNLPGKDGRQVLAEIKADPSLRRIPVVILTGSDDEADILQSYRLNANCYIQKPGDLDEFSRVVRALGEFWFCIVKLPETG